MSYQFYDIIMASLQWCHNSFSKITSYKSQQCHHIISFISRNYVLSTSSNSHNSFVATLSISPKKITSTSSIPVFASYKSPQWLPHTNSNDINDPISEVISDKATPTLQDSTEWDNHLKYLTVNSRWQNQLIIRFTALSDEKLLLKYPAR